MPNKLRLLAFVLLLAATTPGLAQSAPQTQPVGPRLIMLIRHAEKSAKTDTQKSADLSPVGFQRADALARVIPEHFPRPDFLIAAKRSKGSNRSVETIEPLAKAIDKPIDNAYANEEFEKLAHDLKTDPKYAGKIVLIAWHHGKLPAFAKALGVKDAPGEWSDNVFDRVWEITWKDGATTFRDLPQKALAGDSQM